MLERLRARGHVLAVATGKGRAGLARALGTTGLHAVFSATRCADECNPKPAPDMLLEIMEELSVDSNHTLVIGDTVHDLRMAAHAGVRAIGVSYGAHSKSDLMALAPLACVDSTFELSQWLVENA